MPGFHKHKNKDSYYFKRRSHGNYHTYQIQDLGCEMVLASGATDGDIVNWDIFYTLLDLNLLHFKESDDTPRDTAPDPESVEFEAVEKLTLERQCEFISRVLDEFALSDIDSDVFHHLIAKVGQRDIPRNLARPIVERLLSNTPYHPLLFGVHGFFDESSPILIACLLHYLFEALRTKTGQAYMDMYEGELIYENDIYQFYLVDDSAYDPEDEKIILTVGWPDPIYEACSETLDERSLANWCQHLTFLLGGEQLAAETEYIGSVVCRGLRHEVEDIALFVQPTL
ncbi:hypothetical protein ACFO0N_08445 [Halobium salinum]|uniref:Uncharacterized protein n=1 Tax=Halobium salinum TaxID=1364940 RepID=A0ABD5PB83_9EURY|nr:hypothetical protein [Halobium salinum]